MAFSFLSGAVKTTNTNFTQTGFILPSEVERALGNPSSNGQILASNTDGVRYWTSNVAADVLSVETLIANGATGDAGQSLISNGQTVYWADSTGYTGSRGVQGFQGATGFTGSQGAQGFQGVQGPQGFQGAIGYTGSQGVQGIQGAIGAQGAQGAQGVQGAIGFTGSQGAQGVQGAIGFTGSQGAQGVQGAIGFTGSQGAQGIQGAIGAQGAQGVQGSSGTSVTIIDSVTNVNEVYPGGGPNNPNGYLNYYYPTAVAGNGVIDTATGSLWVYSGTTWNDVGRIVGPQGPIGYTGSQGAQGFQGAQGAQGFTGSQGPIGYTGSQGAQGFQGAQGSVGFTGSLGAQGFTGSQGSQGRDGNFGGASFYYKWTNDTSSVTVANGYVEVTNTNPTLASFIGISNLDRFNTDISSFIQTIDDSTSAIKGSIKLTEEANNTNFIIYNVTGVHTDIGGHFDIPISFVAGAFTPPANDVFIIASFIVNGDKGDPGPIGYTGSRGAVGFDGSLGYTGSKGTDGIVGYDGSTGAKGDIGYTGSQGAQGVQGAIGVGYTGSQGAQGFQGVQGTQGNSGFVGSKGVTYIANTAPVPAQPGDTWWNSINGVRYVYYTDNDSSQWVQETSIGPIGFTGFVGSRGDLGYTGSTGIGTQGASGYTGSASTATGPQGAQGGLGYTGSVGTGGGGGSGMVLISTGNINSLSGFPKYLDFGATLYGKYILFLENIAVTGLGSEFFQANTASGADNSYWEGTATTTIAESSNNTATVYATSIFNNPYPPAPSPPNGMPIMGTPWNPNVSATMGYFDGSGYIVFEMMNSSTNPYGGNFTPTAIGEFVYKANYSTPFSGNGMASDKIAMRGGMSLSANVTGLILQNISNGWYSLYGVPQ